MSNHHIPELAYLLSEVEKKYGRRIATTTLTQHATSEEGLQLARLMTLPGREYEVDAYGIKPLQNFN